MTKTIPSGTSKIRQSLKKNHWTALINDSLTIGLIIMLGLAWYWALPQLSHADQLINDLNEQTEIIKMEELNNKALKQLAENRHSLDSNLQKIYAAIPNADEEAENMISTLEDVALKNHMLIDAIGIRLVPESQVDYDELKGFIQVYEYTFSLEGQLSNLLGFISSIRHSMRLADIMTLDIEEDAGVYRSNVVIYAYHLTPY